MDRLRTFNPLSSVSTGVVTLVAVATVLFYLFRAIVEPYVMIQTLAKAIGLGSTYALVALGFVLIFKGTQVVNFAQGALAMVGALFLSFLAADEHIPFTTVRNPLISIGPEWFGWALSVIVALVIAGILGLVLERVVIRPMIGQPLFSVAVITLGLEAILRTAANDAVQTELRPLAIPWGTSGFTLGGETNAGGLTSGGASIAWAYVAAAITAVAAFLAVYFFYRSRMGVAMRAVAFDQEAAMAQGINVGRVFAIAWIAGSILAAIGGIFATQPPIAQTGAVQLETQFIAFRALPAVILGGLDSVQGALVGGLIIGLAEITAGQYLSQYAGTLGSGYPLVVPYLVMIVGLLVRPYGFFGTPEVRRV
ncbi:MAG: branched-chain amino acid ABC transporter permease [Acidimicrobiia bacterium]|nr:branched-chain amino acid ABC transporter permease [Acidimicrobiia bacterium]